MQKSKSHMNAECKQSQIKGKQDFLYLLRTDWTVFASGSKIQCKHQCKDIGLNKQRRAELVCCNLKSSVTFPHINLFSRLKSFENMTGHKCQPLTTEDILNCRKISAVYYAD